MKKNNLTVGSVVKAIVFFALPLLGCSLIQQLYTTVDLIFVSRLLGTQAAAAVGASDLLVTCLVGFFSGMAVGTSVYAAQYFGSERWGELHRLIQTIFIVGIVGGLLLMVAGELLAPVFLNLMGTPEAIMSQAVIYLRVYMLGMISIVSYNLLSGVIRALGDSRSPMVFQTIGGIINIGADFICIAVLKMGVEGTAIATWLSQTVAAVMAVVYLIRMKQPYALKICNPIFDIRQLNKVFRVGVPAGLQSIVITLSNIIVQSQINTLGVASIAAFTVYFKTEMILYLPILALGQAVVSFVGQNVGAGLTDRIRRGNRFCVIGGSVLIFGMAMLILLNGEVVLGIFTTDTEVISLGMSIMKVTFPLYFLCAVVECLSSNLRGHGQAMAPMMITVVCYCGIRLMVLFFVMSQNASVSTVAVAYPVSWGIAAFCMFVATCVMKKDRTV